VSITHFLSMMSPESVKLRSPERKYETTSGIAAFVGLWYVLNSCITALLILFITARMKSSSHLHI
jgi:hypothetical protein